MARERTSLPNIVSGFYKPGEGRLIFKGKGMDVAGMPPHKRVKLGLSRAFQHGD